MSTGNSTPATWLLLFVAVATFVGMAGVLVSQVAPPPIPANIPTSVAETLGGLTVVSVGCFLVWLWLVLGKDPAS